MSRMIAKLKKRQETTLEDCPIGLFLSNNNVLCLKTEYHTNNGEIEAYIVESGEFYCGDRETVYPVEVKKC